MKKLLTVVLLCLPAFGQTAYSGAGQYSGGAVYGGAASPTLAFAQPPQLWVHNFIQPDTQPSPICNPPGGVYTEADVTLSTQTVAALQTEINLWSGGYRRIKVPAGWLLNSSTYQVDSVTGQHSLIILPRISSPTGCLVIESDNPPTRGQMLCSHGLPGFGGDRNPGCTNDIAHLWTIRVDGTGTSGYDILYFPPNSSNIVVRDFEATIAPSSNQSKAGAAAHAIRAVNFDGVDPVAGGVPSKNVGIEYFYIHGWDPGDAGQPAGACSNWAFGGTLTTGSSSIYDVARASGNYFGMTYSDGTNTYGQDIPQASITINGNPYLITSHDPAASDTTMTISPGSSPSLSANTTYTYTLSNPPTRFANGCGDDVANAVAVNCDNCWVMWGYIEKLHDWSAEGHAISGGFSNGPIKVAHNWVEAGSIGFFTGGAPVDMRAGPVTNYEIRGNLFSRNPDYRFLSANTGHTVKPPFGCGPLDKTSGHDNCAFSWSIKNSFEFKFGFNVLIDGNIIENVWADGQTGTVLLADPRAGAGGSANGIFDASGLPRHGLKNIRFSNNWIRNAPSGADFSGRGGSRSAGNGVTQPVKNWDWINNLWTNLGDTNQWGDPGQSQLGWGGGYQDYLCTMTRDSGLVAHAQCAIGSFTGPDTTNAITITSITRVGTAGNTGGTVTMVFNSRKDPYVGGTVVMAVAPDAWASGTAYVTGNLASTDSGTNVWKALQASTGQTPAENAYWTKVNFNGTFTITHSKNGSSTTTCTVNPPTNPTPQNCIGTLSGGDTGLFADTIQYTDNTNANVATTDTLCSSSTTCGQATTALGQQTISVQSHAYRITDISPGDPVVVFTSYSPNGNGTHGLTPMGCYDTSNGNAEDGSYGTTQLRAFAAGYVDHLPVAGCATGGSPCTDPAGLDVYYPNPLNGATGSANSADATGNIKCWLENSAGNAQYVSYINNTAISPQVLAMTNFQFYSQEIDNTIKDNIWAGTDAGTDSFITCQSSYFTEGNNSLTCWDAPTFTFGGNVLQGRSSSNWTYTHGSGVTANATPASASCSTTTPDSTCVGWRKFINGTAFANTACDNSLAPVNCPQMAAPWANNLTLGDLQLCTTGLGSCAGNSAFLGKGVNTSSISSAFTSTQYVCPAGLSCGAGGPYKDAP